MHVTVFGLNYGILIRVWWDNLKQWFNYSGGTTNGSHDLKSVLGLKSSLRSALFFQSLASSKIHTVILPRRVDECDFGLYHLEGWVSEHGRISANFVREVRVQNASA